MSALSVDVLERWAFFGAHWSVVEISDERAVVDLSTCTGELVERRESDDPALVAYLRTCCRYHSTASRAGERQ